MESIVKRIIKNDYLSWKQGDTIIINTYTGSGKTHFIFNELLSFAIERGKKIIYFCNRRSIKNQLLSSYKEKFVCVNGQDVSIWRYLHVFTYQYCEKSKQFGKFENLLVDNMIPEEKEFFEQYGRYVSIDMDDVLYYIYDEAHYFVSDASFNSDVSFWEEQELMPKNKISVFLTATPEPLYCFLYFLRNKSKIEGFLEDFYLKINKEIEIKNEIRYIESKINEINEIKVKGPITEPCKEKYAHLNQGLQLLNKNLLKEKAYRYMAYLVEAIIKSFDSNQSLPENFHIYQQERSFDNYDCFYFEKFEDIMELIVKSDKKTLIFVDNESQGKNIESEINNYFYREKENKKDEKNVEDKNYGKEISPKAVFISASLLNVKQSPAKTEYENLIKKEMFSCNVLIATSVIDCGINISDKNLGNIVLAQPNKTSFFQMMGRCRIDEKTKINLYIKAIKSSTIAAFSNNAMQRVDLARRFLTDKKSGIRYNAYGDSEINYLLNAISSQDLSKVIVQSDYYSSDIYHDSFNFELFKVYKINYPNLLYNFYSLYWYYGALLENKENDNIPIYYLIKQLSWLGKKYDITKWVGYEEKHTDLNVFLQSYVNSDGIDKKDKDNLRKDMLEKILTFPTSLLPQDMQKNISKYKKGKMPVPQMSKLNKILVSLNMPYSIEKKSRYSEKWVIKKWGDN